MHQKTTTRFYHRIWGKRNSSNFSNTMNSYRQNSYYKKQHFNKNKNRKFMNLEYQFRSELDSLSKNKDLAGAIALYESAPSRKIHLTINHFNSFLYLCSVTAVDSATKESSIENGFRIFDDMVSSNIEPNEATITALARLAAANGDGDRAFELVKGMGKYGVTPKLRSYDPVLMCFCSALEADKAYEVETNLESMGLCIEEQQIAALLNVSAETGKGDKVYEYMHKLRSTVRSVSESTAEVIESWFKKPTASKVGSSDYDAGEIKDAMLKNGCGWHGKGWMGKGEWAVCKTTIEAQGRCCRCSEQLACVDIDKEETNKFAESIAALALERESRENFRLFIDWLNRHATYEAVVDGANIGLYKQNFEDGSFSISQLESVVNELHKNNQKWPLVILHIKRYRDLMDNPESRKLMEKWKACGGLYTTPSGSNDDWYWIYAAVKLKCLLVTNDEMRDHIFELFGSKFILRWKERHQVRFKITEGCLNLRMPPPYSIGIQESENGKWHVPIPGEGDADSTSWLCITRSTTQNQSVKAAKKKKKKKTKLVVVSCNSSTNGAEASHATPDSSHNVDCKTAKVSGKRKNRS